MRDMDFDDFKVKWRQNIPRRNALMSVGRNKMRTYRSFKHKYGT